MDLKGLLPRVKLDLKQLMLGAPYLKGDYVIWSVSSLFAEAEAIFRIVETYPEGVVTVANETDVEVETTGRNQLSGSGSPNSMAKP